MRMVLPHTPTRVETIDGPGTTVEAWKEQVWPLSRRPFWKTSVVVKLDTGDRRTYPENELDLKNPESAGDDVAPTVGE